MCSLLAAWLPVTLHSKLEAAGVFTFADECCSAAAAAALPDTGWKDDACPTVEDALFKESCQGFKVAAPTATECFACLVRVGRGPKLSVAPALHPGISD